MKGRTFSDGSRYRYGFNGKEKDDETSIGAYDFDARIYDSRLGRWMSIDPLFAKYPDLTSYQFAGNSPIIFYDIDGEKFVNPYTDQAKTAETKLATAKAAYEELK
jgi:RHS repeat-associated protein